MKEQRVILREILVCMPTWEPSATVMLFSQSGLATGLHVQQACDVQHPWWEGRDWAVDRPLLCLPSDKVTVTLSGLWSSIISSLVRHLFC